MEWLSLGLGKLFGMGETWVEAKTKQATAKVEAKIRLEEAKVDAKITREQKDADASNDIDLIAVKNQRFTWTDEFFKVTFLLPFICMFIPPLQPYVISGFIAFDEHTPDWYKYILYAIAISELGMRRMFMNVFGNKRKIDNG
jgi:hypothetical protein